jgi:hypothetical protein
LATFFIAWLAFGPKPVDVGVAAAEAAGEKVRTSHHVVTGLWRAAWVNLVICILLLPFSRRLTRALTTRPPTFSLADKASPDLPQRWAWGAVLIAAAMTLFHAVPRLDHGLWHDESKGVRNFVVGQYNLSKSSGEIKYREITWLESVWNYRFPNHTLFGLLARTAHTALPPGEDRPDRFYVNETAIRLPSLFGALGGLATTAWLLLVLGLRRAAVITPLLLCVHPWFLRYAAEARGYSLLFLLGPLCIALAVRGLQDGRWRWWIGLVFCQFLLVWSVLNALYLLIVLNAVIVVWLLAHRRDPATPALAGRWLVAGLMSTLIAMWMMMPLLPQFLDYVESTGNDTGKYGSGIVRDMVSAFTTGMRYQEFGGRGGGFLRNNIPATTLAVLVGLFALFGAWALSRRGLAGRLTLVVLLLPAPLFYLHCTIKQPHIFYWYVLMGLPLFWAVVATGCSYVGDRWVGKVPRPALVAGGVLFLALLAIGQPKRQWLSEHPIEAERESVLAVRGAFSDPTSPRFRDITTIGFTREPILYDVSTVRVSSVDEFETQLGRADAAGKPAFVNYSPHKSYQRFGKIMELIDSPELFETVKEFEGIDAGTDRVVRKYIPGSFDTLRGKGQPQTSPAP